VRKNYCIRAARAAPLSFKSCIINAGRVSVRGWASKIDRQTDSDSVRGGETKTDLTKGKSCRFAAVAVARMRRNYGSRWPMMLVYFLQPAREVRVQLGSSYDNNEELAHTHTRMKRVWCLHPLAPTALFSPKNRDR
jgi:hypothetical protein